MVKQENLLKEIKSLSDAIRRKNRALKLGINERDAFLESTFKPVIEPIKEMTQKLRKLGPSTEGEIILPLSKYEEEQHEIDRYEDTELSEESDASEPMEDVRDKDITEEDEEVSEVERKEEEITNPSNISKLGTEIASKGELGRKYVLKMLHSTPANRNYHVYGARLERKGMMIGNSLLDVDEDDNILIGDKKYKGTLGLFELIFRSKPSRYSARDLKHFKTICHDTNTHRKGYLPDNPIYRNRSEKYRNVISDLFPSKKNPLKRRAISSAEINIQHKKIKVNSPTPSGEGLLKNTYSTNIIYYNDANKLVDRMRLIHEAIEAGHTGLENEWVALIDELRNRQIIV